MKLRSLSILVALAAALFLTMACGGDDSDKSSVTPVNNASSGSTGQALKDYFQQLSTILTNVDDQSRIQLHSQYPGAGSDPDQTRQYLSQFLPVTTKALSDIKSLNAPSAVKDRHDKLVSVLEDLVAAETRLSNDVASINDASELKAYFDSHQSDFTAKTDRVNAACSDLQTVANNNNVGIDLKCSGAASPAPSPVSGSGTAPTPDSPADAWLTPGTEVRFGISDPSQPIEAASGLRVEAVDYALQRIDFALIGPYSGPLPGFKIGTDDLKGVCQVMRVTSPAGDTGVNLSAGEELVFTVEYACEKGRSVKFVGVLGGIGIIFERP